MVKQWRIVKNPNTWFTIDISPENVVVKSYHRNSQFMLGWGTEQVLNWAIKANWTVEDISRAQAGL